MTEAPLQRDEIRELIHIAHEEGFSVMAHVNGAAPVLAAVEAGVDSVEHGNFLDEETLQALSESPIPSGYRLCDDHEPDRERTF